MQIRQLQQEQNRRLSSEGAFAVAPGVDLLSPTSETVSESNAPIPPREEREVRSPDRPLEHFKIPKKSHDKPVEDNTMKGLRDLYPDEHLQDYGAHGIGDSERSRDGSLDSHSDYRRDDHDSRSDMPREGRGLRDNFNENAPDFRRDGPDFGPEGPGFRRHGSEEWTPAGDRRDADMRREVPPTLGRDEPHGFREGLDRGPDFKRRDGPPDFARDAPEFNRDGPRRDGPPDFRRDNPDFRRDGPDDLRRDGPPDARWDGPRDNQPGFRHDGPPRDGPGLRRDGPDDFRRDGPKRDDFRRDGPDDFRMDGPPHLRREGSPDFRRDGLPEMRREGPPDLRRDGPPDMRRDGPEFRRDGPDFRQDGPPDLRCDGPLDRRHDGPPEFRRDGPDFRRDGPDFRRDGPPNMRRDGPDDFRRDGPEEFNRDGPPEINRGRGRFHDRGRGRGGPDDFRDRDWDRRGRGRGNWRNDKRRMGSPHGFDEPRSPVKHTREPDVDNRTGLPPWKSEQGERPQDWRDDGPPRRDRFREDDRFFDDGPHPDEGFGRGNRFRPDFQRGRGGRGRGHFNEPRMMGSRGHNPGRGGRMLDGPRRHDFEPDVVPDIKPVDVNELNKYVDKFGDPRFRCFADMGPAVSEEVVIGRRNFEIKLGAPPRKIQWDQMCIEVFADPAKRGIVIDGQLLYKFGERVKDITIRGRKEKIFYLGRPVNIWIDGHLFEIRVDSPPKSIEFLGKPHKIQIDGRDMMILIDKNEKGKYGGEPRYVFIDEDRVELRFDPPPRTILIDGKLRELQLNTQQPCVNIDGVLHGIRFDGPPRDVYINGKLYQIFTDHAVKLRVGNRFHYVALGGPCHEIIIDGKWFELKFNEPPKEVVLGNNILMVRLPGPPPEVKILPPLNQGPMMVPTMAPLGPPRGPMMMGQTPRMPMAGAPAVTMPMIPPQMPVVSVHAPNAPMVPISTTGIIPGLGPALAGKAGGSL